MFEKAQEKLRQRLGRHHAPSAFPGAREGASSSHPLPPITQPPLEWPGDRAFPSFPQAAEAIDAADLSGLNGEQQGLLTSLQGLVNRTRPRLYLYWDDPTSKAWLEAIRRHATVTDWSASPLQLFEKYRAEVQGAIIYEANVPDTINLATTLAGSYACIIASAELARACGLQVVYDLRGMFRNKLEVYSYGLRNVYPHLTKRLIAAIPPLVPGTDKLNAIFRDYVVALAAPCIWLDPDEPAESRLLADILKTFSSNAAYMGWFPHGHEMTGVTQTSRQSVYVVACDFFFNGSLTSGLKSSFPITPSHSSINADALAPLIENKVYLSLTWSEGDNIQYCQHRLRDLWDDPARGRVPMGWTVSPLLVDIAPNILHHFQSTATAFDALVVGPSGAGYTNPVNWDVNDLKLFLNQTRRYLYETGTGSSIWVNNRIDGKPLPVSRDLAAAYRANLGPELLGICVDAQHQNSNPYAIAPTGDLPVAGLLQIENLDKGAEMLRETKTKHLDTVRGPLFVACSLIAWNFGVGDVVRMVEGLGAEFEVVRPDELLGMVQIVMRR